MNVKTELSGEASVRSISDAAMTTPEFDLRLIGYPSPIVPISGFQCKLLTSIFSKIIFRPGLGLLSNQDRPPLAMVIVEIILAN